MKRLLFVALLLASSAFAADRPIPRAAPVNPAKSWDDFASVLSSGRIPVTVVSAPSDSTLIVHVDGRGDPAGYHNGTKWSEVPRHFSHAERADLDIDLVVDDRTGQRSSQFTLVPIFGNSWHMPIKSVQPLHETKM